jgi:hypothetical protein
MRNSWGGKRANAGQKGKNHPSNSVSNLQKRAWFRELKEQGGSISNILKKFECYETIEIIQKNFAIEKNEPILPSRAALYRYKKKDSAPHSYMINRIGSIYPETLKVWDFAIWRAIENKNAFLSAIKRKYQCTIDVVCDGVPDPEFEEIFRKYAKECEQDGDECPTIEECWDEQFGSGETRLKLPAIVCLKLPTMDKFCAKSSYFIPQGQKGLTEELYLAIHNPHRPEITSYDILKHQIRSYVLFGLLSAPEGICDILAIDIATRSDLSLSSKEISLLPTGIQFIYHSLLPEIKRYDSRQS